MSINQHDSSAVSLNNISKIKGFYYLPILKDESVSPRFCEITPRKQLTKKKKDASISSPVKSLTSSMETPVVPTITVNAPEIAEEDVLAVRRLESAHSPRVIELPVLEPTNVEPFQERIILPRRLKPKSRGNLIVIQANASDTVSTEYVHHFMDEEESELPSPDLYDARQDFSLPPLNDLDTVSGSILVENSSTYDNTIVCDYRYILDPSSSPSRGYQEPSSDSVLFSEEFLTYGAMTINSRPNSRPASVNTPSRSRKNSVTRPQLTSGGSPVTRSLSISLGNQPSGVMTVEDYAAAFGGGASATAGATHASSSSPAVSNAGSPGYPAVTTHAPTPAAPPPSSVTASPNVVRRTSQRIVVPSVKSR